MNNTLPNFKRRKLLGSLSILGLSSLTGCVPMATNGMVRRDYNGAVEDSYRSMLFSSGTNKEYSYVGNYYNQELSNQSQKIFNSIANRGVIPKIMNLPAEYQADDAISLLTKMKEKYSNKKELELSETYEVMQNLIPLTRMFVDLNSVNLTTQQPSSETGYVDKDGTLHIPPGYKAVSLQLGYCLNEELPAPGRHDRLTIVPSSELIPQELMPLYRAMQTKAFNDKSYRNNMQKLMWTLRAAGKQNSLASHVEQSTLADMDKAMPGGAEQFINYHNQKIGGGNGAIKSNNKQNTNENIPQKLFQSFLSGLNSNNGNSAGAVPEDNRNYQMLSPNVATYSVGNKQLVPQIEIVNFGSDTYSINLADYIMKPSRKQQHVAMYPSTPDNILFYRYPISPDPAQVELFKKLKDKVDQAMLSEAARFLSGKVLKGVSKSEMIKNLAFRMLKDSPASKILIGSLPILGNALSAYEAISGKNWVNGRDLNAFERSAAVLGTIPGGAILGSVFRERIVSFAGMAFAGAGMAVNQGVMQKEVAAYSQAYTNPINFASEFVVDKINNNINQSLVQLSQDKSIPKPERIAMMRYLENPVKPSY